MSLKGLISTVDFFLLLLAGLIGLSDPLLGVTCGVIFLLSSAVYEYLKLPTFTD